MTLGHTDTLALILSNLRCIIFKWEVHDWFFCGFIQQLCGLSGQIVIAGSSHQHGPDRWGPAYVIVPILQEVVWRSPGAVCELDTGGVGGRIGVVPSTGLQPSLGVVPAALRKVGKRTPRRTVPVQELHWGVVVGVGRGAATASSDNDGYSRSISTITMCCGAKCRWHTKKYSTHYSPNSAIATPYNMGRRQNIMLTVVILLCLYLVTVEKIKSRIDKQTLKTEIKIKNESR